MDYKGYRIPDNKGDIIRTVMKETGAPAFVLKHTDDDGEMILAYPLSQIDSYDFNMNDFIRFCKANIDKSIKVYADMQAIKEQERQDRLKGEMANVEV